MLASWINLKQFLSGWQRIVTFGLLLVLLAGNIAWAASPNTGDIEEQNRRTRQQEAERQQRQQNRDVFLQPKATAETDESLPEEAPAFFVKAVQLEGERIADFAWLSEKAARYNGRSIGKAGIQLIVKRLNNALIERGYITSQVLIPEQDLSQNRLSLLLVAGTIGDIRFDQPMDRANWHTAFPTCPGNILNLRDLEQGLEQLKRIPSQDVAIQLVPGQQPGQSDVVIRLERHQPWKVIVGMDDSGNTTTGRLQASTTVAVDNLLGFNDVFHVSINQDTESHRSVYGTNGNSFYWSFPHGYWTYSFSTRSNDYKQTLYNGDTALVYTGESQNVEFKSERLLRRDQTSKTSLYLKLLQSRRHNYINDTEITVQRIESIAMELGLYQRRYSNNDIWDYQLAYRQGKSKSGFQTENDPDDGIQTIRYGIWTGEVNLTRPTGFLGKQARYNLTVQGQYSTSTLYAPDCFSIGNRYTVRGFDGEQTLSGEWGWFWRNELAVPLDNPGWEIYFGLDYGQVGGPSTATLASRELLGSAVGLRGEVGQGNLDVFIGWPIKKPNDFTTSNPVCGFQFTYQI